MCSVLCFRHGWLFLTSFWWYSLENVCNLSSCRCIKPQLKSLALGFHALATRTLGKAPSKHILCRARSSGSGLRYKLCCHLNYPTHSKMLVFADMSAFEPYLNVYSDRSELCLQNLVVFQFWGMWLWKCAFGPTAGIPAPIYFGAIIDTTCLKWGQKRCGGIGACRIYNTTAYR